MALLKERGVVLYFLGTIKFGNMACKKRFWFLMTLYTFSLSHATWWNFLSLSLYIRIGTTCSFYYIHSLKDFLFLCKNLIFSFPYVAMNLRNCILKISSKASFYLLLSVLWFFFWQLLDMTFMNLAYNQKLN